MCAYGWEHRNVWTMELRPAGARPSEQPVPVVFDLEL
jgi:hypothetical protein